VRLRDPFTFFVDRSFGGRIVAGKLAEAGHLVEPHDKHFPQDAEDTTWIRGCGTRQWVILSKDVRIRSNDLEREALLTSGTSAFFLGRRDLTGPQMGDAILAAMPRILRALRRFDVHSVGSITQSGGVSMLWIAGERLAQPKELK
jgi:hypothetical protein